MSKHPSNQNGWLTSDAGKFRCENCRRQKGKDQRVLTATGSILCRKCAKEAEKQAKRVDRSLVHHL